MKLNRIIIRILVYAIGIIIGLMIAKLIWSTDLPDWLKVWLIAG